MKKITMLSMTAVVALSASSINEAFIAGKASGQIRIAHIDQNSEVDADTYGTSLGGILKYETADWSGLKLGVGAYISGKLNFASGDANKSELNADLFAKDASSYVYVGEAYADYTMDAFNLKVGRQQIDTPFADTDDIRMHPNTFEAAIATYTGFDKMTLVGGYVTRWAGFDSGDDISQFKKFAGDKSDGVVVVGAINESIENLAIQGWFYDINKLSKAFYTDATYTITFSETMGLVLTGQYANFSEANNALNKTTGLYNTASNIDGSVYGVGAVFNINALTVGATYNKASNNKGKSVVNGFGGGPYLTSMEEMTIDGHEDAQAYQISTELDMGLAGIDGLTLTALYGDFKSTPAAMHVKEIDLIAAYEVSKALNFEVSYAMVNDKNKNTAVDKFDVEYDGGYDRFLVRLNYNF